MPWGRVPDALANSVIDSLGDHFESSAASPSLISPSRFIRACKPRCSLPYGRDAGMIVGNMGLTGLDAPSMRTMYIDKP